MMEKQIKHFVSKKSDLGNWGYPACHCYKNRNGYLVAIGIEYSVIKGSVTCKNCRRTRVFKKLK